jgi:vancomycin resistance protein YoaR
MSIGRENKTNERLLSRFRLFILKEPRRITLLPSFSLKPVTHNLENIRIRYRKDPKDALFSFDGERVTAFAQEEYGTEILVNQALSEIYNRIEKAMISKTYEPIYITINDQSIAPVIKLSEANQFGIRELIGSGSSDFSGSIENRIFNIEHASSKMHGLIIRSGDEFSFNKLIGDISAYTGYKQAYVIKDGKTVLGDGGGVCQVSTTLFRAALNSGLKITERFPHAYRVHYYEENSSPGMDATVFAPSVDFKFINNTNSAILIQVAIDKSINRLVMNFYGTKDDRKITISPVTIWDILAPPEALYQDDPTLPTGVVRQVDWAAWGAKAKFTYYVEKDGKVLYDEEFVSSYRPWQAIYLRGVM